MDVNNSLVSRFYSQIILEDFSVQDQEDLLKKEKFLFFFPNLAPITPPTKAPIGPPIVKPIIAPMAEFQNDIYLYFLLTIDEFFG